MHCDNLDTKIMKIDFNVKKLLRNKNNTRKVCITVMKKCDFGIFTLGTSMDWCTFDFKHFELFSFF
jgi:hypothetical protein